MFTDETRSPIAAADLARALVELLLRPDAAGLFHGGGPEALTRCDLARREAEAAGLDPDLVVPATRAEAGMAGRAAGRPQPRQHAPLHAAGLDAAGARGAVSSGAPPRASSSRPAARTMGAAPA